MPLAMKAVFRASTRRLGSQRGYQAGSAVYWATCWGVAAALVGPRRLAALWHPGNTELPDPPFLAAMVLAVRPLGAITTQWLPNARDAGPVGIAAAAGVGITNALAQEALWRGVPVSLFPGLLSGAGSGPPWASPPGTMCLSPPSQPAAHGARPFCRCCRDRPGQWVDRLPDRLPAGRLRRPCDNRRQRAAASRLNMASPSAAA
jgi:hypothetical protein